MSITYQGWVTHGKVANMEHSLKSFINQTNVDDGPDLLICNDAFSPADEQNMRSLLNRIAPSYRQAIYYAGQQERIRLINQLTGADIPHEVLAFLLINDPAQNTCGANRNTLLLAAAGATMVSSDDDVVSRCAAASTSNGVSFSHAIDPMDMTLFRCRESLLKTTTFHEANLLRHHDRYLGQALADLGLRQGSHTDTNTDNPHKITVTMSGIGGDSGMGSPKLKLRLQGEQRQQMMASRQYYNSIIHSRQLFRAPRQVSVSKSHFLMSCNIGIDATGLVPPFLPAGRNAESIFAFLLSRCFPGDHIAYLPIAVLHQGVNITGGGIKTDHREQLFDFQYSLSGLTRLLLFHQELHHQKLHHQGLSVHTSGRANLKRCGEYLRTVAQLDSKAFEKRLGGIIEQQLHQVKHRFESLLEQHHRQPDFWAEDIEHSIDAVNQALTDRTSLLPREFTGERATCQPFIGSLKKYKAFLNGFGNAMIWWPTIYDAAQHLGKEAWMTKI